MQLKRSLKSKFFVGITNKQTKYIIHTDFMVANEEITDQFIQNIRIKPNKQIHKISSITDSNGKTKYLGRTFTNIVLMQLHCL